ncbi:DUF3717 domain-containing protein [Paraburkholderia kururiensis]|uniref:DUF3717 domain-containing protein n=1 Tax=Paraburkholderia kururiensis TaxID=984307 RepID=UPI000A739709|nr:DUF3717 domain-containing protein [Paraburkholderia kururiensis]
MNPQPADVPIAQLECAINHWRERRPSADPDSPVLCAEARALADVYGLAIYHGWTRVSRASLNDTQRSALDAAQP